MGKTSTKDNTNMPDKEISEYTNEELRLLVELLLGNKSISGEVSSKVMINNNIETVTLIRTVVLDILLITPKIINIEIENHMNSLQELVLRARYYKAMATSKYGLKTGEDFTHLKHLLTFFIVTKRFKEDKDLRLVILPEKLSKEYLNDRERTIFLSTYDMARLRKTAIFRRMKKELDVDTREYYSILTTTLDAISHRKPNVRRLARVKDTVYLEKFRKLGKGVKSMNYVKEALLEGKAEGRAEGKEEGIAVGELIGKVKLCKYGLKYNLNKTIEFLHKENKDEVISTYHKV